MTRINVVPVSELCDKHCLAEHREITRIPNTIVTGKANIGGSYPDTYKVTSGSFIFVSNGCIVVIMKFTGSVFVVASTCHISGQRLCLLTFITTGRQRKKPLKKIASVFLNACRKKQSTRGLNYDVFW